MVLAGVEFVLHGEAGGRIVLPLLPNILRAVGLERRARERRTLPFDPLGAFAG